MVISVTFEHVVRQTCNQRASLHKLIIGKSIVTTDRCLVALRITEHFSMSRLVTRWTALRPRLPVASVLAMPKLPQLTYRPRTLSTKPKPSECERSASRWPKLSQLTHRSRTLPVKPKPSERERSTSLRPTDILLLCLCVVACCLLRVIDPLLSMFVGWVTAILLW